MRAGAQDMSVEGEASAADVIGDGGLQGGGVGDVAGASAVAGEHSRATPKLTAGADLTGGDECIESGAAADVENVLAGLERAQGERVADAREGFDGTVGGASTIERG
jgi:hypothetical protein